MAISFTTDKSDDTPYNNFTYQVEVDGTKISGFSKITGIGVESDVLEYQEGGLHDVTHKFPDETRYANVKLHRGVTQHDNFIKWITKSVTNAKKDVAFDVLVTIKDREDSSKWGWKLLGAQPVRWEGPQLLASSSGLAIELLELSYEELEFIKY